MKYNYKSSEKIESTTEMNVVSSQITTDGTYTGVLVIDSEDADYCDNILESMDCIISYH